MLVLVSYERVQTGKALGVVLFAMCLHNAFTLIIILNTSSNVMAPEHYYQARIYYFVFLFTCYAVYLFR